MDPEALFLRRCEQAAILTQSNDEAELLDLAGLLRQLLMDKFSLFDTANKGRVKPKFHVGVSRYAENDPHEAKSFWSILDGLDPQIRAPGAPSAHLTRDQFLKHVVTNHFGNKITIMDIIDHAANVSGGVHHDPRPKTTAVARANSQIVVKGFPIATYYLQGIARITLRALQPVIDDVQKRRSQTQSAEPAPLPDKSARPKHQ